MLYGGCGTRSGVMQSAVDTELDDMFLFFPRLSSAYAAHWRSLDVVECVANRTTCADAVNISSTFPVLAAAWNTAFSLMRVNMSSTMQQQKQQKQQRRLPRPAQVGRRLDKLAAAASALMSAAANLSSAVAASVADWHSNATLALRRRRVNNDSTCSTQCVSFQAVRSSSSNSSFNSSASEGDPSRPPRSEGHRQAVVGSQLFHFGGYSCTEFGSAARGGRACYHDVMYVYDLKQWRWRRVDPPPADADAGAGADASSSSTSAPSPSWATESATAAQAAATVLWPAPRAFHR